MKNFLKLVAIATIGLVVLTGCRSGLVNNIEKVPTGISKKASDEQIFNAIKKAGYNKGWQVRKIKPGLAEARIMIRSHSAIVNIPYSESTYSIEYKNSQNLNYDPEKGTIHSNYNGWISNLNNAIAYELGNL